MLNRSVTHFCCTYIIFGLFVGIFIETLSFETNVGRADTGTESHHAAEMVCPIYPSYKLVLHFTFILACAKKDGCFFQSCDRCTTGFPSKKRFIVIQRRKSRLEIPFEKGCSRSDVFWRSGFRPNEPPRKERTAVSLRRSLPRVLYRRIVFGFPVET